MIGLDVTAVFQPYRPEDAGQDAAIGFAVIAARHQGKWVLCRHEKRSTWESPGGHRERGETPMEAARRELFEETGAIHYQITPVCVYSLKGLPENAERALGLLCYAQIDAFGQKPPSEIAEIKLFSQLPPAEELTYLRVHQSLIQKAAERFIPSSNKPTQSI